ncbi:hypothetical protein CAEBREN_10374 [Caenorhabditis brenneri]|uniref:Uncharacterized protein n=1 Tax=Caenorhabditis brenneri TaxID=135651 RepID=G0MRN0_CAEBE|nr:hypothetical protein CAEBREN_10374 [Caenorhabditis brenneri]
MGKSFLFFILLLGSTTLAITDPQQKFLDEVNGARERYSNEYNVPDMHKLVWSDDLQEILSTLAFNESWPYARVIWRYTELDSYEGVTQKINDELETFLSENDKATALTHNTLHGLELLNPLQNVIACEEIPNDAETKLVCLVWNEELVKIIDPINWKGEWPFSRRMWRFCVFVSYQKQIDLIKNELDDLIGKSAEERKSKLAGMNTSRMGKLEVLNPRQSEIGCVRKWIDLNTISIVCLVGTRGQAELWDFDAKSTEEPGSACPENYKNDDGLCIPVDPTPVSIYGNRQDFMKQLNDVRRRYAKEYKIPNMHQLVWSEDLVKISESLGWVGSWPAARITWRFTKVWSYRNIIEYVDDIVEQLNRKTDEKKAEWIVDKQRGTARELELLNPLQTVVGCAEKIEVVTILSCLIGSEGSLTLFDFTKKSSAVPGSTCSKNYKNEDGLCVPDNAADVSYFGYREDFLSGVNELRRSIAKQYHIPNMHELKWHEDFVDTAQSDTWPSDHPSWRYTKIKSYRDLKTIEDEVNGFISKTDDEKKSFVTDNESLNGLELMNPEQTLIGCGKKKGEDNALTCLIGTQGTWPEVTFDSNSEVAPGSKCLKDYENTDGLCTFFSPTPPPPKKVIPQGGAPKRIERVTQRIPEAAAQQSDEKDEPDTATTKFSSYLMISFSIILFLY